MKIELLKMPELVPETGNEYQHKVRLLSINGRSRVLRELKLLKRDDLAEFKKLSVAARYVSISDRVMNKNHVKESKRHPGIYEMRGGRSRLFFFYNSHNEVVICTNLYLKKKGSKKEQNRAFETCARIRDQYNSVIESQWRHKYNG